MLPSYCSLASSRASRRFGCLRSFLADPLVDLVAVVTSAAAAAIAVTAVTAAVVACRCRYYITVVLVVVLLLFRARVSRAPAKIGLLCCL